MIVEFKLQGSYGVHQGVFESTGFFARFEEEYEEHEHVKQIYGYKIVSHFSFSYYHTDEDTVKRVFKALVLALQGHSDDDLIQDIGYIKAYT